MATQTATMSYKVKVPISQDLRFLLPNPDKPHELSPEVFKRVAFQGKTSTSAYNITILEKKEPEYKFALEFFRKDPPPNRMISRIQAIHNPVHTAQFNANLINMEVEAAHPTFKPKLEKDKLFPFRKKTLHLWEKMANSLPICELDQHTIINAKVMPMWHGTSQKIHDSILSSGFSYFGKHAYLNGKGDKGPSTDAGFFGSGIYLTPNASYAHKYAQICGNDALLLVYAAMRIPYPVVSDKPLPQEPTDMRKLKGLGAYQNYNAHFIPVVSTKPEDKNWMIYYPCTEKDEPQAYEVVVFHKSQILPRFLVETAPILLQSIGISSSKQFIPPHGDEAKESTAFAFTTSPSRTTQHSSFNLPHFSVEMPPGSLQLKKEVKKKSKVAQFNFSESRSSIKTVKKNDNALYKKHIDKKSTKHCYVDETKTYALIKKSKKWRLYRIGSGASPAIIESPNKLLVISKAIL